ncbi:hypothetical protein Btru_047902 [Bulinus truncatus]|nr:hypothetical protein Btru_047902 [Bulinus truncatus]
MEVGSNSSPYNHISKTTLGDVPFSQAKDVKTLRQSNVPTHNGDKSTDFRSVLHRPKNLDEPNGKTVSCVKNSELCIDFRNILKNKQKDDGIQTGVDVDPEDLDVQEVLFRRKEKRSVNSSADVAAVKAMDIKPKHRLHEVYADSDSQDFGSRLVDSKSIRTISDDEIEASSSDSIAESDGHLNHLFKVEPSPVELYHTSKVDNANRKLETGAPVHSSVNFDQSGDSVGQYTAIPIEFKESNDKIKLPIAGVDINKNNSSEIVFQVQMSLPVTFVQSYEVDMTKETGLQNEMSQPGLQEQPSRKVSYIEFTPKTPSKSSSGSEKWSTHHTQELTAKENSLDNPNDDSDDVFGENTHSETLNISLEGKKLSGYDSWRDSSPVHGLGPSAGSGILKSDISSGHVRFSRHSEDNVLKSTSEDKTDKKSAGTKSSSKSTSTYEGQKKPEFQCVQLRHASRPPGSSDLRASKNLSKSTEMLFNVRLKPVVPKNDNSSAWKKSQFSSSPASTKAKSKSSFDLADRESYQRSSKTQRPLPGTSQLGTTSTGKVWKNDAGNKRSAIYSKDWSMDKRGAGKQNDLIKTVPSTGDKLSLQKSYGRITSHGARYQEDGTPGSEDVRKTTEDKQTFQTKVSSQVTVTEKKKLSDVGKSLSNDGESVQIPESYLGRYKSKRHSLQADSDLPVSLQADSDLPVYSVKSKFSQVALKDSQSLSKSIGNLNISTSSKVSSKRELFETLEQSSKPNWQKNRKTEGDRMNHGSKMKVSSKRESSYFDAKPEWGRNTTRRNIDEKINAIRKEKLEKIDNSATPIWVKTGELNNSGRSKDIFKETTMTDYQYGQAGALSEISPPSKAKVAPPVAPKPAAKLIANNGVEEVSVFSQVDDFLKRLHPASDRQSEHDSSRARVIVEVQDHSSMHDSTLDVKSSLITSSGQEVRSSLEDMDSAISMSSSSSEVSSVTNDFFYNGEDTRRRLRVGHNVQAKNTARKNDGRQHRENDELAECVDIPGTDPDMFNKDSSTFNRSSKRGSQDNIVDLTATVQREHSEVRLGSTSSQDSGLILDISNTVINTADVVTTDTDCQAASFSLEHNDLDSVPPAIILKDRREKRLADKGMDSAVEPKAPDKCFGVDIMPQQNKDNQAAYDRAREYRSKFRDSKNKDKIDLASSDLLAASAQAARTSEIAAPAEKPVARPRLKDRLRNLASDHDVAPRSSSPVNYITTETDASSVGTAAINLKSKVGNSSHCREELQFDDVMMFHMDSSSAANDRQPGPQLKKDAVDPSPLGDMIAVTGHKRFSADSAADDLTRCSTLESLSAAPPAPYSTSTPSTVAPQPTSPPNFPSLLKDVTVMYGCRAVLQCTVIGDPTPDIKWLYNMTPIEPSQNIEIVYEETVARLIVLETYSEHVGDYCCWAKNPYGSLSTHCRLELEVANSLERSRAFEGPVSREPRIVSLTPRS